MDAYQRPYEWISLGLGVGLASLSGIAKATNRTPLHPLLAIAASALAEPDLRPVMVETSILASVALTLALGGFILGVASGRRWGALGSLLCLISGAYWLIIFIGDGF